MTSPYFYPHQQHWQNDVKSNSISMTAFNETRNIPETVHEIVNDQMYIKRWLSTVQLPKKITRNTILSPSIYEMKEFLRETLELCEEIERAECVMRENIDTFSCGTWEQHFSEITALKNNLMEKEVIMKNNAGVFDLLKKKLAKRTSKRQRLKRHKAKLRSEKQKQNKLRDEDNNAINIWMTKMQEELLNKKHEENVKFETDIILRDVIKRKTEAKRYLSLLEALQKLRTAREKSAIGRGQRVDRADAIIFNKNIDKLATMWSQALEKYLLEEKGLKEKLDKHFAKDITKNNTEIITIKQNLEEEVISQWRENLFGMKDTMPQRNFNGNIEAFIFNRTLWDQYLWMNDDCSQMPSGWVTPPEIPTDNWRKYLRLNAS